MLNPLLIKEFRMKARGMEAYVVGVIYILVLSALAFGLFWEASSGGRTLDPEYGIKMFIAFVVAMILAVCLICPAFTVGAVSSEREHLTFHQLRITLLKPRQILLGKALPPIIYILVLIIASIPIASLIAPVGGVSLAEIFFCYVRFKSFQISSKPSANLSNLYFRISQIISFSFFRVYPFSLPYE